MSMDALPHIRPGNTRGRITMTPQRYDMKNPVDRERWYREMKGYLSLAGEDNFLIQGTDRTGRRFAWEAFIEIENEFTTPSKQDAWRYCPDCKDTLTYSHRVTLNSWTYTCQRCKTTHHITEDETTKERKIDVYDERGKLRTTIGAPR